MATTRSTHASTKHPLLVASSSLPHSLPHSLTHSLTSVFIVWSHQLASQPASLLANQPINGSESLLQQTVQTHMGVSKVLFFPGRKGGRKEASKQASKQARRRRSSCCCCCCTQSKTTLDCRKVCFFHYVKLITIIIICCLWPAIWQTRVLQEVSNWRPG